MRISQQSNADQQLGRHCIAQCSNGFREANGSAPMRTLTCISREMQAAPTYAPPNPSNCRGILYKGSLRLCIPALGTSSPSSSKHCSPNTTSGLQYAVTTLPKVTRTANIRYAVRLRSLRELDLLLVRRPVSSRMQAAAPMNLNGNPANPLIRVAGT